MNIPLRDGSQFDLAPFVDGLKAKYPHVDIDRELALLHLWLGKNKSAHPVMPLRFVENWLKKVKPKTVKLHLAGGRMTESDMISKGRELGIQPRPGESWPQFGKRLADLADKQARQA